MIKKNLFVYISCNVILALILIWCLGSIEPFIRHIFFPLLPEAEIQTYMIGIGIFSLFQILAYAIIKTQAHFPLRISTIGLYTMIFIANILSLIGVYLLANIIIKSSSIHASFNLVDIYLASQLTIWHFILAAIINTIVLYLLMIEVRVHKITFFLSHIGIILVILWLTTGLHTLNLYDYGNYAGPIHDFLSHRPLLTFTSLYGFLPIYFLSYFFRVIPLTAVTLHITIAFLNGIGFVLYFFFNKQLLKKSSWAFLLTIWAIFVQHLISYGEAYQVPQQTLIRMGCWLLIAGAIYLKNSQKKKHFSRLRQVAPFFAVGLNMLWTFDFGLYSLVAFALYLFFNDLQTNIASFIKTYLIHILCLFLSIVSAFALIDVIYTVFYGFLPNWNTYYFSALNFSKTTLMVPVPNVPILWIYILVYVLTISYILYKKKESGLLRSDESAVLFSACIGLTSFNYFLGRSFLNSILVLSLPFFVCFFYLLKVFFDQNRHGSLYIKLNVALIIGVLLSIPTTLVGYQGINNLKKANPITTANVAFHTQPEALDEQYWVGPTANELKEKYGDEITNGRLTMLSDWDIWFFIIFNTTNKAGINCMVCFFSPTDDIDTVVKNINASPSQYLFVDQDKEHEWGRIQGMFSKVSSHYDYVETIGFLEVYKRNNK